MNTGGTVSFVYPKGYQPRFSEVERGEFVEARKKAEERERRERRNGWLIFIVIMIVIFSIYLWAR